MKSNNTPQVIKPENLASFKRFYFEKPLTPKRTDLDKKLIPLKDDDYLIYGLIKSLSKNSPERGKRNVFNLSHLRDYTTFRKSLDRLIEREIIYENKKGQLCLYGNHMENAFEDYEDGYIKENRLTITIPYHLLFLCKGEDKDEEKDTDPENDNKKKTRKRSSIVDLLLLARIESFCRDKKERNRYKSYFESKKSFVRFLQERGSQKENITLSYIYRVYNKLERNGYIRDNIDGGITLTNFYWSKCYRLYTQWFNKNYNDESNEGNNNEEKGELRSLAYRRKYNVRKRNNSLRRNGENVSGYSNVDNIEVENFNVKEEKATYRVSKDESQNIRNNGYQSNSQRRIENIQGTSIKNKESKSKKISNKTRISNYPKRQKTRTPD